MRRPGQAGPEAQLKLDGRSRRQPEPAVITSASWPVSRVLSTRLDAMDDHSSGAPVAGRLVQPTRMAEPGNGPGANARHPYSVLLPVGFTVPPPLPETRCALTAPFHPYPEFGAVYFLWHFPWGFTPAGRYPAPCSHGARTFLYPRAFGHSRHAPRQRPSGQLAHA